MWWTVQTKTYGYDEAFQAKVVALVLREPTFLPQYNQDVLPAYFDDPHCAELISVAKEYYEERSQVPIWDTMKIELLDRLNSSASYTPGFKNACMTLLYDVYQVNMDRISQVADKVVEFARARQMEALIYQLTDMLNSNQPVDEQWELIDKARVNSDAAGEELDIGTNLVNLSQLVEADGLYNPQLKIKTLIPSLDEITAGGLGRKECGLILAPTGAGKSTFLVNMGAAAALQGFSVIHFSVNELENIDLAVRYGARITGLPVTEITSGRAKPFFAQALRNATRERGLSLVSQYVQNGTSVSSLRSFISRRRYKQGVAPDMIIIDNADGLTSSKRATDQYSELGQVYTELKGLAHDFGVAIWADSQTNRSGVGAEQVTLGMIGDSYRKACKADLILTLSQTKEEDEKNLCRLVMVKARRTERGKTSIRCSIDRQSMTLQEVVGEPKTETVLALAS